jgi:23S rRNA pseudouridine1911/1915/1917 synthase
MPPSPPVPLPLDPAFATYTVIEFLAVLWPERPRRALESLFASGRLRSAGKPVSPRRPVGELADLSLHGGLEDLPEVFTAEGDPGVEVLWEDERLVTLSKPAGVPVVPDRDRGGESCLGFLVRRELAARRQKPLAKYIRPRVVHRIDRQTSGLVLVAREPAAERELSALFESRRVAKEYLCLVVGEVVPARVSVDVPIEVGRKGRGRAGGAGKTAFTEFDVLERFEGFSVLLARPRTGRTHQIRIHAWAMGHPLAVDPLYRRGPGAAGACPPGIERLTLHAWRYTLPEGWQGRREFACPLAADFREAWKLLR